MTPAGISRAFFYASIGPDLFHYALDPDAGTICRRGSISLPADVRYAWPHSNGRLLYVASSDTAQKAITGGKCHHITALRIDALGALHAHGEPVPVFTAPVHISVDQPSRHVLVAYNRPSALEVFQLKSDGAIGSLLTQSAPLDAGIFAHQVRVTPDDRHVILVARGNDAEGGRPEDPGSLTVFEKHGGALSDCVTIAPGGGYGFGPRHLDFHPHLPVVYVSLERQNEIWTFGRTSLGLTPEPLYRLPTLRDADTLGNIQWAGTIHVHPQGQHLYGCNRAFTTVAHDGRQVVPGGENNIVVCAINKTTGEPRVIQHVDSGGIYCRTFHIDPTGTILIAAHAQRYSMLDGRGVVRDVPAGFSVFRIGEDGLLTFIRAYEVDVGDRMLFWCGMVAV